MKLGAMDFVEEVLDGSSPPGCRSKRSGRCRSGPHSPGGRTRSRSACGSRRPREFQGVELTTLHIETDLLADVPMDATTWTRLASVNQYATLSAYVADAAQRTDSPALVGLADGRQLAARASIALHAMALQMADAYARGGGAGGGVWRHGRGDAASAARPARRSPTRWSASSRSISNAATATRRSTPTRSRSCVHLEPRPWTMAANELHAAGCGSGIRDRRAARLELDASERHPSLGSGLQMRLLLPVEPDEAIAQKLNANECLEPDAHQLGAWCVDRERGLMFTGFVPGGRVCAGPVARARLSPVGEERLGARVAVPSA